MAAPEKFVAERKAYTYQGRKVYEWDQTTDDVNVYVRPPAGVRAGDIACMIRPDGVVLGLKGNPPFLNSKLWATCRKAESFWTFEDGVVHITLTKMEKNHVWPTAFMGHGELDPLEQEQQRKRLLLERFQGEHGGFDFSAAQVNGNVPDPATFLNDLDRHP
eukprot:TRINITY_DN3070_c0_g4_i1.p2 TRINITY_DN3070_c0_g4~~TRINITY_DN3070_c0_g4_i1.p2  ORF type:complete len:161 (-),score=63.17 TRINITY_DN3070_c0_g4_i1:95-577(-)